MVRNMNLDAVLDDYDGGADYDEDNVETDGEGSSNIFLFQRGMLTSV